MPLTQTIKNICHFCNMIIKELHRKLLAIATLFLFLLSTSGMVLFYHYCQHAHEMVFSMYVDSTQELCHENAVALHKNHCHSHDCDYAEESNKKPCCEHHQSKHKIVQLKTHYTLSYRLTTPQPTLLSLFENNNVNQTDIIYSSLVQDGILKELPPEISLHQPSGRELVTSFHTLKIAC